MQKFHLGFTGTRRGLTSAQLDGLRMVLNMEAKKGRERGLEMWLRHGDCLGADAEAHALARSLGYRICLYPPLNKALRAFLERESDDIFPARPYLDRNKAIVDNSSLLIACPAGPEVKRSGTWSCVRHARRWGCPRVVVWADGRAEREA